MQDDWVVLRLPPELLAALRDLAKTAGVTPGQYLRDHLAEKTARRPRPDPVPLPRGRATAVLQAGLAEILSDAGDWAGLQAALIAQGFALRAEGLSLDLYAWPSGERVCKSKDLGFSYASLIRRLGPGEPPAPGEAGNRGEPLRAAV